MTAREKISRMSRFIASHLLVSTPQKEEWNMRYKEHHSHVRKLHSLVPTWNGSAFDDSSSLFLLILCECVFFFLIFFVILRFFCFFVVFSQVCASIFSLVFANELAGSFFAIDFSPLGHFHSENSIWMGEIVSVLHKLLRLPNKKYNKLMPHQVVKWSFRHAYDCSILLGWFCKMTHEMHDPKLSAS